MCGKLTVRLPRVVTTVGIVISFDDARSIGRVLWVGRREWWTILMTRRM